MANHRIARLEDWYQVIETLPDGSIAPIGSFRTEADAQSWLNTYLRMQNGAQVFQVNTSADQSAPATEDRPEVTAPKLT